MNNLLHDYDKQKTILVEVYNKLKETEFLPCKIDNKEITKDDIEVFKQNLIKEHFIISVCGQVKAGKSTLLNYLLFNGEEVLPTDPTPCTAKLSKICYSQKEKAEVYFYTEKEWEKLKSEKVSENEEEINYYEKYLKEFVNKSAMEGIYDKEFIKEERICVKLDSLDDIKKYISKEGLYTPFVSQLDIYTDNEFIKNATIVDTPGINDSNALRSKTTEDWISQSNAILMLMYAGQALTKVDLDFIDSHLSTVSSDKIIFALSKVDVIEGGIEGAKQFVKQNLKSNEKLKQRKLLENKDVYCISTMAAIINCKNKKDIKLTDREEFFENRMDEELIESEGNLPALYEALQEHIMKNKGNAIIKGAKSKIKAVCDAKIKNVEVEYEVLIQSKEFLYSSSEDRKNKKEQLDVILNESENIKCKYNGELDKLTGEKLNEIAKSKSKLKSKIMKEYDSWSCDFKAAEVISGVLYKVKELLDENIADFLGDILNKEFEVQIDDIITSFVGEFKRITKNVIASKLDYIFYPPFDINKITSDIKENIKKELCEDSLKQLKEKAFFVFTKNNKTKQNIKNRVDDTMDGLNDVLYNLVKDYLESISKNIINKIHGNMNTFIKKLDGELGNINNEVMDYDNKVKNVNDRIHHNDKLKEKLHKEFDDIKLMIK
ncbi:dynamin family protein [Clostridium sp.]|uniref:dynamin family protein n=1 Tax=Clostridium sp. TaxID=1506 RepID=UPI003D6CAC43